MAKITLSKEQRSTLLSMDGQTFVRDDKFGNETRVSFRMWQGKRIYINVDKDSDFIDISDSDDLELVFRSQANAELIIGIINEVAAENIITDAMFEALEEEAAINVGHRHEAEMEAEALWYTEDDDDEFLLDEIDEVNTRDRERSCGTIENARAWVERQTRMSGNLPFNLVDAAATYAALKNYDVTANPQGWRNAELLLSAIWPKEPSVTGNALRIWQLRYASQA